MKHCQEMSKSLQNAAIVIKIQPAFTCSKLTIETLEQRQLIIKIPVTRTS